MHQGFWPLDFLDQSAWGSNAPKWTNPIFEISFEGLVNFSNEMFFEGSE